jgi:hypothetical protein
MTVSEKYKGYYDFSELPDLRGKRVKVPAHTKVSSTNPRKSSYVLSRPQTVVVHHLGCGMSACVGHMNAQGERRGRLVDKADIRALSPWYETEDVEALVHHEDARVLGYSVFLPVSNPTVVWVGSGGYWCEADINVVTVV